LSYTVTNVTSCTASSNPSGAWSGTVTASGQFTTPDLTATTVFTLTCTGEDGSTQTGTVTVNVTPASTSSTGNKNGGGAIGTDLLALLLGALVLRLAGHSGLIPLPRRIH
jgi:hypothetical protein